MSNDRMSNDSNTTLTRGVHHAGLTVPDLAATRAFFVDGLGFDVVGEKPDYPAVFLSDGGTMITLWQAEDPTRAIGFDRRANVGLHHVAFTAPDLELVLERLTRWPGVEIEFEPEPLAGGPARHLMCAIPGGIRVEFIAPAAS